MLILLRLLLPPSLLFSLLFHGLAFTNLTIHFPSDPRLALTYCTLTFLVSAVLSRGKDVREWIPPGGNPRETREFPLRRL